MCDSPLHSTERYTIGMQSYIPDSPIRFSLSTERIMTISNRDSGTFPSFRGSMSCDPSRKLLSAKHHYDYTQNVSVTWTSICNAYSERERGSERERKTVRECLMQNAWSINRLLLIFVRCTMHTGFYLCETSSTKIILLCSAHTTASNGIYCTWMSLSMTHLRWIRPAGGLDSYLHFVPDSICYDRHSLHFIVLWLRCNPLTIFKCNI